VVGAATAALQVAAGAKGAGKAEGAGDVGKTTSKAGDAGNSSGQNANDLVKKAQQKYPNKAGKTEKHHVDPKYLGGDPKGETVELDGAYHQEITNEFREKHPYGKGKPTSERKKEIIQEVYDKFPLPDIQ
jgi:hypothetical protein